MSVVRLPIVDDDVRGSILADGHRKRIVPADVSGPFHTARMVVFAVLIALAASLPWIRIGGAPAVFLDIDHRMFFLFGATLNAQDTWLLFFLLSGAGFSLVAITAIAGRAWCGWTCPQTVLLDGVYRRIERWFEGARAEHIRRDAGATTFSKVARKAGKHASFAIVSIVIAHVILSYFVSLRAVFHMVVADPMAHPEAFAWTTAISVALYANFAFFREQLCVVLCPYGRLQSVLLDDNSLVVGYDKARGEPRGKKGTAGAGDCVDCNRCVVVCPTGIDIRQGSQLDCVACTACIDACDDVMHRLGRATGLIRYDSERGLAGLPRQFLRPRIALYAGLLVAGVVAASLAFRARTDFEANVMRLPGAPFVIEESSVRNGFDVHVVNKVSHRATFAVAIDAPHATQVVLASPSIELDSLAQGHIVFFVTAPRGVSIGDIMVHVRVTRVDAPTDVIASNVRLLGVR